MKKLFVSFTLLMLVIASCTPQQQPTEQPVVTQNSPSPTQILVDLTPAQRAAVKALSETLSLSADKITLVSTEDVTWPDGCLGVVRMGMMCTQAMVEGFKIVLEANGNKFEYHTNQDGSSIVAAQGMQNSGSIEEAAIKQLAANLGLKESDIKVVSTTSIEFGDACLGVAMEGIMCAQVITPGLAIVLEAKGTQYEYHTSADGSRIQPATLALTWTREGGIAGFCDYMTVFLSGEVYTNGCKSKPEGAMDTFANLLTAAEQKQFNAWIAKFGQTSLDASDPEGVSDRMVRTLNLFGAGKTLPGNTDKEALFNWAQNIFQKLNK